MTSQSNACTQAEVDALVAIIGRLAGALRAGIEESDGLARAGEVVGYESAYRVLRRAVVQVLEDPLWTTAHPQIGDSGGVRRAHEAHGRCGTCGHSVHRYTFGWQHVGTGMYACDNLDPLATCCAQHAAEDVTRKSSAGKRRGNPDVR